MIVLWEQITRSVRSKDLSSGYFHFFDGGVGRLDPNGHIMDTTNKRISPDLRYDTIRSRSVRISRVQQWLLSTFVLVQRWRGTATESSMQNYIQRQECTVEYSILPIIQYYKIKYSSFLFPSQSEQVNCDIQHFMNNLVTSSHLIPCPISCAGMDRTISWSCSDISIRPFPRRCGVFKLWCW